MIKRTDFSPSNDIIKRALTMPQMQYRGLPTFIAGAFELALWQSVRDGDQRIAIRHAQSRLRNTVLDWPWLEERSKYLAARDLLPVSWKQEGVVPGTVIPPALQHRWLVETLHHLCYGLKNATDALGLPGEPRLFGLDLIPCRDDCPAELHFRDLYRDAIQNEDLSDFPPYFPGGGCAVELRRL